jgi:putative ABC transport system permease protein
MTSSERLTLVGILSCTLIVSCVQPRQASGSEPPSTTYQVSSFEFQNNRSSQKVRGASVTPAFFQSAEVVPLLGRGFLPEEYRSSRQQVAMISERFWRQQFGGDPRIIGTTVRLNEQTFTVIGIMPPIFDVPSGVDIWVPKAA